MSKHEKKNSLADAVMDDLHKKNVHMHSPLYFLLLSVLLGVGVGAAVVVTMFFVAVAWVRISLYQPFGFFRFGFKGIPPFMAAFPWGILFVAVVGIGVSVWLLKKYDFTYKRAFLPFAVVIIAGITVLGFACARVAVSHDLHQAPHLKLLQGPGLRHRNWIVGRVLSVEDSRAAVRTPRGEEVLIIWNEDTRFTRSGVPSEGDVVRAVGVWQDDVFTVHLFEYEHHRVKARVESARHRKQVM